MQTQLTGMFARIFTSSNQTQQENLTNIDQDYTPNFPGKVATFVHKPNTTEETRNEILDALTIFFGEPSSNITYQFTDLSNITSINDQNNIHYFVFFFASQQNSDQAELIQNYLRHKSFKICQTNNNSHIIQFADQPFINTELFHYLPPFFDSFNNTPPLNNSTTASHLNSSNSEDEYSENDNTPPFNNPTTPSHAYSEDEDSENEYSEHGNSSQTSQTTIESTTPFNTHLRRQYFNDENLTDENNDETHTDESETEEQNKEEENDFEEKDDIYTENTYILVQHGHFRYIQSKLPMSNTRYTSDLNIWLHIDLHPAEKISQNIAAITTSNQIITLFNKNTQNTLQNTVQHQNEDIYILGPVTRYIYINQHTNPQITLKNTIMEFTTDQINCRYFFNENEYTKISATAFSNIIKNSQEFCHI